MPIYEYVCQKCGHHLEIIQKMSDKPLTRCPECRGRLEKVISQTSFQLKGSGWYVSDYGKGGSKDSSKEKSDTSAKGESPKAEKSEKADKADTSSPPAKADKTAKKEGSTSSSSTGTTTNPIEPRTSLMAMGRTVFNQRSVPALALIVVLLGCISLLESALAQSGRSTVSSRRSTVIPVIATRLDDPNKPRKLLASNLDDDTSNLIGRSELEFYDGGVVQKIQAFAPDQTPARIVVLMDNSGTLQIDVEKLASVPAAFAPEIYEGDKVMVVGYDLKPEIITEFTDDPKELQSTLSLLRKTDSPRLFDALNVVMEDVLRPAVGYSKRVVVIVGDGLDRGSQIKFDQILGTLQDENITVYAIQARDRTRGALRKDSPKAADAIEHLTTGTGGKAYPLDGDIKQAVKEICDELRNNRYQLTYYPEGVNPINKRRLLLTAATNSIALRYKASHPPHPQ